MLIFTKFIRDAAEYWFWMYRNKQRVYLTRAEVAFLEAQGGRVINLD